MHDLIKSQVFLAFTLWCSGVDGTPTPITAVQPVIVMGFPYAIAPWTAASPYKYIIINQPTQYLSRRGVLPNSTGYAKGNERQRESGG